MIITDRKRQWFWQITMIWLLAAFALAVVFIRSQFVTDTFSLASSTTYVELQVHQGGLFIEIFDANARIPSGPVQKTSGAPIRRRAPTSGRNGTCDKQLGKIRCS